ncbi:MAG: hypothetical protein ACLFR8_06050 [Alkalispirochaeta sp.]
MSDVSPRYTDIPSGTVHRTIGLLHGALTRLHADMDDRRIEGIGVMVHRAMSTQQRTFHTPEHIFDLSDPENPHTTLAAIFHDIVYYQVDDGFLEEIAALLDPYISCTDGSVTLKREIDPGDRAFWGCAAVFAFEPGQTLSPFGGLNEFLSALVMDRLLEGTVADRDLLIATACIEATIPFRRPDSEGRRPPEILRERIAATNDAFGLGLSEADIDETVRASVCFSNQDVGNFSESDPGRFLDNTWKLLPESNPSLRLSGLYTIASYSTALMKMEGFLSSLRADDVFNRFRDYPDADTYRQLIERTAFNLAIARRYLGIKMISIAILRALADLTGGDAPVAFFMGDIDPRDDRSSLVSHLPPQPAGCIRGDDEMNDLFRLLKHGRASSSRFDLQNSPLSLYVHQCLDEDDQLRCIEASKEFLTGARSAEEFLDTVPAHLVAGIARAAGVMAFTRGEQLRDIARRYERQER